MESITMSQVIELADPKLKAITKRAVKTLQLAAEKAIANDADPVRFPLAADASSAEKIFLSRFKQLTPAKQQAAAIRVMETITAPEARRAVLYGDLAQVNLRAETPVATQAKSLVLPEALKFPESHLRSLTHIDQIVVPHPVLTLPRPNGEHPSQLPAQRSSQQVTDKLEFRIHKVRCIDATQEISDDEINMAGIAIDESGDTKTVAEFIVREDFKDGVQQTYVPPRRFTYFNLLEGKTYPKIYLVTPIVAEKDSGGGFVEFLNQLWNEVDTLVTDMIGAAIGGIIGSMIPGLGTMIGMAVGLAVTKLIAWFMNMTNDDILPVPSPIHITIPSLTASWPGGLKDGPEGIITYTGNGGIYQVTFDWRLFA